MNERSPVSAAPAVLPPLTRGVIAIGAVVVVLGMALRLYGLGAFSLWYDEAASLYHGQHLLWSGALFDYDQTSEPPVNTILVGIWQGLVDRLFTLPLTDWRHDFLLRLLPCGFGIASVPLVGVVARRIFRDNGTALCAMLLFAVSPLQVYYAQEIRVYTIYVFVALLALLCVFRALDEDRMRHWVGMTLLLALLMYCHFIAMWVIFALNVAFVCLLPRYRHLLGKWTAANGVVLVLIAPMLHRAFVMHAEVQGIEITWYPSPTWKTVFITYKNFFAGYSPATWAYWPLFLLALGLSVAAFRRVRVEATALVLLACLSWVPVVGCAWVWGRSDFSFYEHRIFIVSGVAALLLVARGITVLGRSGHVALLLIAVVTLPCLADVYRGRLHPIHMHRIAMWDKVDFRDVAAILEERWQPGDRLLYASHFSAYPMFHYFPRDQVRIGWDEADESQFIKTMGHETILHNHGLMPVPKEKAVAGAERLWFLATEGITFEWQPDTDRISGWIAERFEVVDRWAFDGIELRLYTRREGTR